jgi:hypothetical protein
MDRVCYGEFDFPDANGKRAYIRNRFLGAIEIFAPEASVDLCQRAFTPYLELTAVHPDLNWFNDELRDGRLGDSVPADPTDLAINRWMTADIFATPDLMARLEIAPDSKLGLL